MEKRVNILDGGTTEERISEMKEFLGLRPDQSFQDLDIEDDENDEED